GVPQHVRHHQQDRGGGGGHGDDGPAPVPAVYVRSVAAGRPGAGRREERPGGAGGGQGRVRPHAAAAREKRGRAGAVRPGQGAVRGGPGRRRAGQGGGLARPPHAERRHREVADLRRGDRGARERGRDGDHDAADRGGGGRGPVGAGAALPAAGVVAGNGAGRRRGDGPVRGDQGEARGEDRAHQPGGG